MFGLTDMAAYELTDNQTGRNTQHRLLALLRQSVYSRLAGFDDTNDAGKPVVRLQLPGIMAAYLRVTICQK